MTEETGNRTADSPSESTAAESGDKSRGDELVFSTRLIIPMLRFFEERFGRAALEEVVASLGADIEYLEDPEQWVSSKLAQRFAHAMVEKTGEPLLTFEAGLALSNPAIAGPTYYLIRALGSPHLVYSKIYELNKPSSRISRWEVVGIGERSAVLRFKVAEGQIDDPLFCLNRQGGLAGIPTIFDLPAARVDHPRCIHHGDPYCEYHVTWAKPSLVGRWAGLAFAGMALSTGVLAATGVVSSLPLWILGAGLVGVGGAYVWDLRKRLRTISESGQTQLVKNMTQLVLESQRRQQELMLLAKVDRLTRRHYDVNDLIDTALKEVTTTLGYDRAMFMMADTEARTLGNTRCVGFSPEHEALLRSFEVSLDPSDSDERLFANVVRNRQSVLVVDMEDYRKRLHSEASRRVLEELAPDAFVAVAVCTDKDVFGLLVIDQTSPERTLTVRDRELLEQLGHQLAMALANAALVQDLRKRQREVERALLLNQKLSLYLPLSAVDHIHQNPDAALDLGGRRIKAAVLFSDIAGFTPWTEANEPEVVVDALNTYFAVMDDIIDQCYGILDKRMGDGMMVVFLDRDARDSTSTGEFPFLLQETAQSDGEQRRGPSIRLAHPARRAILCGLRMQRAIRKLNRQMQEERMLSFAVRIGIAFGEVVAGNIGSSHRLEYTVIGDVVNVASRLESSAATGAIFTNEETLACAGMGFTTRFQGELRVKGRLKPVRTYEVLAKP